MPPLIRGVFLGMVAPVAILWPILAVSFQYWSEIPLLGSFARMLESTSPQILLASLPFALVTALLGAPRLGILSLCLVLASGAWLTLDQRRMSQSLSPEAAADLTVIWFNMEANNKTDPVLLANAMVDSGADIILTAESRPMRRVLPLLVTAYPYRQGCETATCEVHILSRLPFRPLEILNPGAAWKQRMMIVGIDIPGRAPLTLAAIHMVKPWYNGITEQETENVIFALRRHPGPIVAMGDFNAAPWTPRLHEITEATGFKLPRPPLPTWPAGAGRLGVPIDHVLTGDGAVLKSLKIWGVDLGSDHRGLIAEISLPPAP